MKKPPQNIPQVFHEIKENQEAREALVTEPVVRLSTYQSLKHDMDRSLRPGAQAILRRRGGGKGNTMR